MTGSELLEIPEVATRLKISTRSVYRLIASRRLAATDVGTGGGRGRTRVSEAALARFIERRTGPAK